MGETKGTGWFEDDDKRKQSVTAGRRPMIDAMRYKKHSLFFLFLSQSRRMPRQHLTLRKADASLVAIHKERLEEASGHFEAIVRIKNDFYRWISENEAFFETHDEFHPVDLWGTARGEAVGPRTSLRDVETARKYGFEIGERVRVEKRINRDRALNAVRQRAAHADFNREKLYPSQQVLLSLLDADTAPEGRELEMMAFWFVCVATGNCPKHVYEGS